MLGQPLSMLIPEVVGFKLTGQLGEGATATDLVLTVTEMLRKKGVVGKFVEFYGPGLAALPLADRATIANMAPEYGYLRHLSRGRRNAELSAFQRPTGDACATGRSLHQGTGLVPHAPDAGSDVLRYPRNSISARSSRASRASPPARPRRTGNVKESFATDLARSAEQGKTEPLPPLTPDSEITLGEIRSSCTTAPWSSPPSPAARTRRIPPSCSPRGLLAKKAVEKGLQTKPGSRRAWRPARRW